MDVAQEMKEFVDPTSRLVRTLEMFVQQSPSKTLHEAWASTFDGKYDGSIGGLLHQVVLVIQLVHDTKKIVLAAVRKEDKELHVGAFNRLERSFSQLNLEAASKNMIVEVNASLQGLRFSVSLLSHLDLTSEVDSELLAGLQSDVESLAEEVIHSDLAQPVKTLLTNRLEALRQAIFGIRLHGPEHVEETIDALFGVVVRTQSEIKSAKGGDKLLDRLVATSAKGYKAVAVTDKLARLAVPLVKLLKGAVSGDPT